MTTYSLEWQKLVVAVRFAPSVLGCCLGFATSSSAVLDVVFYITTWPVPSTVGTSWCVDGGISHRNAPSLW